MISSKRSTGTTTWAPLGLWFGFGLGCLGSHVHFGSVLNSLTYPIWLPSTITVGLDMATRWVSTVRAVVLSLPSNLRVPGPGRALRPEALRVRGFSATGPGQTWGHDDHPSQHHRRWVGPVQALSHASVYSLSSSVIGARYGYILSSLSSSPSRMDAPTDVPTVFDSALTPTNWSARFRRDPAGSTRAGQAGHHWSAK
eukprot:6533952-Pyramimonas_sp.AAC.1